MELKTRVRAVAPDFSNFVCAKHDLLTGESSKHPTHGQHFQFWSGHLLVVVPFF